MSTWQVSYSRPVKILLKELKRVTLGEFFEDLDVGRKIQEKIGIKVSSLITEEQIGKSRLGSKDIFSNFGITFILISSLFLLFLLVIFCGVRLSKRNATSEKIKGCFKKSQDYLLFNPLIRYSMLNYLKLNFVSMAAFYGMASDTF